MIEATPLSAAEIGRRSVAGAVALAGRQVVGQAIYVLGSIAIARLFTAAEFGFYAIALFAIAFLRTFGDIGLGASLIRQDARPTPLEMRAVFSVQLVLTTIAAGGLAVAAPVIATNVGQPGVAIPIAMIGVAAIVTSFRSIPAILLERDLRFAPLARTEVAQALAFNGIAVALALAGFGITSVALGLVGHALIGSLLVNRAQRWPIGWAWDWTTIRAHLNFGLPYQGIALASLLKQSVIPIAVGIALGPAQVGYLFWAETVATYPLLALAILQRLYLPAFARMTAHPASVGPFVERVLFGVNALFAPIAILELVLIEPITLTFFGPTWLPAIPLFVGFWIAYVLSATVEPLLGMMVGFGRSKLVFAITLAWALGYVLIALPAAIAFGPAGYAIASVGVQAMNIVAIVAARRMVEFRLAGPVGQPWAIAVGAGAVAWLIHNAVPSPPVLTIALAGGAGLASYLALLGTMRRAEARAMWMTLTAR